MQASEDHRLLRNARERIAASWTQNADARRADGDPVDPWRDDAVSWSLLGALVAGYDDLLTPESEATALSELALACVRLAQTIDTDSLTNWNDLPERTQTDVLTAIDTAAQYRLNPPTRPPFSAN